MANSPNLFLFTGEDSFTAHKTLKFWAEEFCKKFGDYNFQSFEGEDINTEEFRNAINTLPFASEKKLIIIRDFLASASNSDQLAVAEMLDEPPGHCVIVFIEHEAPDARTTLYKKIVKVGQIKNFPKLEPHELTQWINTEFNKIAAGIASKIATDIEQKNYTPRKASLGPVETRHLAESVGSNLWQMSHELEKIALYSQGKNPTKTTTVSITTRDIDQLISPNLTASIFKLTDAIAAKNSRTALKILQTLLQSGEDLFQTFYMIARQFRILLQVKFCLNQNMSAPKIIQKLKEKPYTITNSISQCKNFTSAQLTEAYKKLLQIDIALKTGKIRTTTEDNQEFRLALEKLIIKMTN